MADFKLIWERAAIGSFGLLTVTIIVWESWGAPSTQTPFYIGLFIKTVPLLVLLPGIVGKNARTHMVATLIMLFYFTEGVILSYSEFPNGLRFHSEFTYALLETILASVFLLSAGMFVRQRGLQKKASH